MFLDNLTAERLEEKAAELQKSGFHPGYDGMSAQAAVLWFRLNAGTLLRQLKKERYNPMPVVGFHVAKRDGSFRPLVRATAVDTVLQRCILEYLHETCDARFSPDSHAWRPGHGVFSALQQYCLLGGTNRWAIQMDVASCFDSMDRALLQEALNDFLLEEPALTRLLCAFAAVPVLEEGRLVQREKGICQGTPLSPFFCNVYLHRLDSWLTEHQVPFVRYGDDLVLFGNEQAALQATAEEASAFLRDNLSLRVSRNKLKADAPMQMVFLGHRFIPGRDGILTLSAEDTALPAYGAWHSREIKNPGDTETLLSDGIMRQRDFSMCFQTENGRLEIPSQATGSINVYSSVIFDTGFLEAAADRGIMINVFDKYGRLTGRFVPNRPLHSPMTTLTQLEAYYNEKERLSLARQFVLGSIHNLRLNIRYYRRHEDRGYTEALERIDTLEDRIKACEEYKKLLLLEAQARNVYYGCFDSFISNSEFSFASRSRRPPRNEVNAMISFGNTLLYSYIATEIGKTALDVRAGFLHATNARLESLNLDVAELFRPLIVDRTVFSLINRRQLRPGLHFQTMENGGVWLTADGKRLFLSEYYDKLHVRIKVDGVSMSYAEIIREEVRKLVRHFRVGEPYKPFKQTR